MQQLHDCLLQAGIAEERGNEFAAAVGFVTAGEAAGQHDNLAALDGCGEPLYGILDHCLIEVADDEGFRFRAVFRELPRAVIFAVCAGEGGQQNVRLGEGERRAIGGFLAVAFLFCRALGGSSSRENRL